MDKQQARAIRDAVLPALDQLISTEAEDKNENKQE
jgi:hypothetical protein